MLLFGIFCRGRACRSVRVGGLIVLRNLCLCRILCVARKMRRILFGPIGGVSLIAVRFQRIRIPRGIGHGVPAVLRIVASGIYIFPVFFSFVRGMVIPRRVLAAAHLFNAGSGEEDRADRDDERRCGDHRNVQLPAVLPLLFRRFGCSVQGKDLRLRCFLRSRGLNGSTRSDAFLRLHERRLFPDVLQHALAGAGLRLDAFHRGPDAQVVLVERFCEIVVKFVLHLAIPDSARFIFRRSLRRFSAYVPA